MGGQGRTVIVFSQPPKPIFQALWKTSCHGSAAPGAGFEEEAREKLLYLALSHLHERREGHRLQGFAEIRMERYHATQTQQMMCYGLLPSL